MGTPYYLFTEDKNASINGVLPIFGYENSELGQILNSLPWYGSYGGCTVATIEKGYDIRMNLLSQLKNLIRQIDATVVSLVLSPQESKYVDEYSNDLMERFIEKKRTQVSFLPKHPTNLMLTFEKRTVAAIKKAQDYDFEFYDFVSENDLKIYHAMHEQHINKLGGLPKTINQLSSFLKLFSVSNIGVLHAKLNGEPAGLLIVSFFGTNVEYILPIINPKYRSSQVLSLLIWKLMLVAIERGCTEWNWGGTGWHQNSLHRFKRGWGAKDFEYLRLTFEHSERLMKFSSLEPQVRNAKVNPYYYHRKW